MSDDEKQKIVDDLKVKGVDADVSMDETVLSQMVKESNTPAPITPTKKEKMVAISDVEKMIAKALADFKNSEKPQKAKRVTEHYAHVWRLDSKWVVDFKDRNSDPYVKEKVHAFKKYNEQTKEFETWIEVIFQDGNTKELSLYNYIQNRVLVYCPIIKRHQKDISYNIGEVEKKKEVNDKLVGTGVMIDQEVEMYEETFEVKTPDGEILSLPTYVIA